MADGVGRPLFASNRDVAEPGDPVAALWQVATTLREHRGDGHVALLAGADLVGCEAHVLFAACEGVPAELYLQSRGWSEQDWTGAVDLLTDRGLLGGDGQSTPAGRSLRDGIERRTDELAAVPLGSIAAQVERLLQELDPPVERIAASGEISFPNPMGLPRPARGSSDMT